MTGIHLFRTSHRCKTRLEEVWAPDQVRWWSPLTYTASSSITSCHVCPVSGPYPRLDQQACLPCHACPSWHWPPLYLHERVVGLRAVADEELVATAIRTAGGHAVGVTKVVKRHLALHAYRTAPTTWQQER